MNLADLKCDTEAIEAGAWVSDIPELPGVALFVRGQGNSDWADLQARLLRNLSHLWREAGVPEEYREVSPSKSEEIVCQCLYQHGLKDWRGLEDNGQPVPFSRELAYELIFDPEYVTFRQGALWAAQQVGRKQMGAAPIELESITIEAMKSPASDGPGYIRDNRGQIQESATPRRRGRTRRKSAPGVTAEPVIESL